MRCSLFLISFLLVSCGSVRVAYDYDSDSDFSSYKTYAFSKEQIENLEISDIDKKRIFARNSRGRLIIHKSTEGLQTLTNIINR